MLRLLLLAVFLPSTAIAAPSFQAQLGAVRAKIRAAAGLPAGAQPASFQTLSRQERDVLVDLLVRGDDDMQIAALRSLRAYVGQTRSVREPVLRAFLNTSETAAVRVEAAKTLSYVSHYRDVEDALLRVGRRGLEPSVRRMALKALYVQAPGDANVRRVLTYVAQRDGDKQARLAAIWGLFQASGDNRTRDALWYMARHDADLDVRVEALRSLYQGMNHSRLHDDVRRMAANTSEEPAARYAAVLLLSRIQDSRTRDLLQRLAQRDADAEIRQAAVMAMHPSDDRIRGYFHLVRRNQNGGFIDPLD